MSTLLENLPEDKGLEEENVCPIAVTACSP
jgi:hypothetical protein